MALILMVVQDTPENGRYRYTKTTLESLRRTVDWDRHRLIVIDNNSSGPTTRLLSHYMFYELITLPENIGQARALNKGLPKRYPGEIVVRMDNDIAIHNTGWVEDMKYVLEKDDKVGIVALKRKNAWEHPCNPDPNFRSTLEMLPHEDWEKWMVIEVADSVLGTCQALRPEFLDKIGFFYQMGSLWGFIDPIICAKAHVLGYKTVYIPHIVVDYLESETDIVGRRTAYQLWKDRCASDYFPRFEEEKKRILSGGSVYHGPEDR